MSKLIRLPLVVLLAGSVAACDTTEAPKVTKRDMYATLEDCVADWGDTELCEREMKESRAHVQKMAEAQAKTSGASMPVILPMFMGPSYSGDTRSYTTPAGKTITPATTTSSRIANYTSTSQGRTVSYTAPVNTASKTPYTPPKSIYSNTNKPVANKVLRGGFGSSSKSFGSSGG